MQKYFRLIRLPNLIIIILTMVLMRYAIIDPQLQLFQFELQFSHLNFFFLVLSTVFITAGGYVINDYFDTKTDLVNHPGTVTVGKSISRRMAIFIHLTLNSIGVLLGAYLSFAIALPALAFIFILIPGLLWFYSTTYKRQFLIGNLIVAFLTGLVPLMVLLFEIPVLNRTYGRILTDQGIHFGNIIHWVGAYSFFAFILTLIREIVKDVEDYEGDNAFGRNTLPIVLGVKTTKWILGFLSVMVIFFISYVVMKYVPDVLTLIYVGLLLIIPLVIGDVLLIKATDKKHYHRISMILKTVMLAGVLYAIIAAYYFYKLNQG